MMIGLKSIPHLECPTWFPLATQERRLKMDHSQENMKKVNFFNYIDN